MTQRLTTPLLPQQQPTHTGTVQEIVSSALATNNSAVELLRNGDNNEDEALSMLHWAIQSLMRPPSFQYNDNEEQFNHHHGVSPRNTDENEAEAELETVVVDPAECESQGNVRMTDNYGFNRESRLGYSQQTRHLAAWSNNTNHQSCGSSAATGSAMTSATELLSPQEISTLDHAALSAYLRSTVTRHDLILHSVSAGAVGDTSSSNNQSNDSDSAAQTKNPPSAMSTVSMANEQDLHTSPGNLFSVYNRPFIVNDQWRSVDVLVWAQSLPHVPAILHYNIGLVLHRRACRSGMSRHYQRALEYYETAARLLEGNALVGVYITELDILLLAIANNLGHIHSHFSNLPQARYCLDRMVAVFFLSECKALMTKDEYVFFYINILLFVNRCPLLAGAA